MVYEKIMNVIIKARTDVLHASRLLAQWDEWAGRSPTPNEYHLLVTLIGQVSEALDSVVTGMVKKSAKVAQKEGAVPSRSNRRRAASRSVPL